MKSSILTIGDASEDIFVEVKDAKIEKSHKFVSGKALCFELGEKIPVKNVLYEIGGSACNTAVGFSRLGMTVNAMTALGYDSAAEKIIKRLEEESVKTKEIVFDDKINTHFSIIFNLGEERTILVYRCLEDYSILIPKKSLSSKWIYLAPTGENSEKITERLVELTAEKNTKIAWNPGSIQIDQGVHKYKNLLQNTSILLLNKEEGIKFTRLTVKSKTEDILRLLHSMGPKIVVITEGKGGANAYDGRVFYNIEALNKKRIDATGAGDSFAVGFVGKLMFENEFSKEQIIEALRWGIINSTSVVNRIGAQAGLLTKIQIEEELFKHPRLYVEIH